MEQTTQEKLNTAVNPSEDLILKVTDLNIAFHDHSLPETVVVDVDLQVKEGDMIGIVGESGSGKTMTALAINGLLNRHDIQKKGEILYKGINLLTCSRTKLRQVQGNDISMIFQEPMTSLDPVQRIGKQVEEPLRLHEKLTEEEYKARAVEALGLVELPDPEEIYNRYPHELSGGQRQRVMIAAAMICKPRILIADEPTTALDVTIQEQIVKLLKKLNQTEKTAILFISHDLSLVRKLCPKVAVMKDGYVVETGETEAIFRNPQHPYTKELIAAIPEIGVKQYEKKSDEIIVSARDLNSYYPARNGKLFGKKKKVHILKDVSFDLYKGEILGLVGESGCGKSTLSKVLLGMVKDIDGSFTNQDLHPQMVFQDPYGSLNPGKKIGWILQEPLKNFTNLAENIREEKAVTMLQKVGLSAELMDRYPNQLSGGQRQRVCIAAALMAEPGFLIADEPVSALDVHIQEQVLTLLKELHDQIGVSILFISHDLRVVYRVCDRVMIMKEGRIVESGITDEVFLHPKEEYTRELLRTSGFLGKNIV
ncbi:MAG: ABC transporter ATP-binding protein [Lachnospiraceae bacterium]|nr:ABC transporter ATP-binding protein [Lachnospiraceae bacterium]